MKKNFISLETSDEVFSIALIKYERYVLKISQSFFSINKNSVIYILPIISNILNQNKLKLMSLNSISFNKGPGSFNGIRKIHSFVQGIGLSLEIPIFGISSNILLSDIILRIKKPQIIAILIDAKMNEVYVTLLFIPEKNCISKKNKIKIFLYKKNKLIKIKFLKFDFYSKPPKILVDTILLPIKKVSSWLLTNRRIFVKKYLNNNSGITWISGNALDKYKFIILKYYGWIKHPTKFSSLLYLSRLSFLKLKKEKFN